MTLHTPLTRPTVLLRLEAAGTLALAASLYGTHGGSWALFALLLLAPDLSALGYLAGPAAGAAWYNAAHTYLVPAAMGAVGLGTGHAQLSLLALIWAAHIGLDRLLGYGLKYPDGFSRTHLGGFVMADRENTPGREKQRRGPISGHGIATAGPCADAQMAGRGHFNVAAMLLTGRW